MCPAEGAGSVGRGLRLTAPSLTTHSLTDCLRHAVEHFTVFYKSTSRPRYRVARSQCLSCRSGGRSVAGDDVWRRWWSSPPGRRAGCLSPHQATSSSSKTMFSKICTSIMSHCRGRQRLQPHGAPSSKVILKGARWPRTARPPRDGLSAPEASLCLTDVSRVWRVVFPTVNCLCIKVLLGNIEVPNSTDLRVTFFIELQNCL